MTHTLITVALWNRADHYIFILSFVLSFFFLLMAALCNREAIYIFMLWFLFLFSSPNLSGRRLDVYHTNVHNTRCGLSVNLECRSETCCVQLAENTARKKIAKKSPSGHHPTTLSGYIFATKACIDNRKKNLLSSNISSTWPPQYGELWPTSG